MKKRILCLILGITLAFSSVVTVMGDQESDLENQKQQNSDALNSTSSALNDAESARESILKELSSLDSQLVSLMSDIDVISSDIASAQQQIDQTTSDLSDAEAKRDEQYSDMETRIRYMYENSGGMTWFSYILQAKDISDLLNRVEYSSRINEYDRQQLTEYEQNIQTISDMKDSLEQNKAELIEEQENLQDQQTSLNAALDEKKAQSADYEADIASLRGKADALNTEIAAQNEQLRQIQAEKQAAAEAAAKAAAESAAAQKAAETAAAAKSAAESAAAEKSAAQAAEAAAAKEAAAKETAAAAESAAASSKASAAADTPAASADTPAVSSSGNTNIGQQIADFACQFVGNPYVVAGESLTEGADCAGFVKAVYAHFGVYFERNLDLIGQLGRSVSLDEAKPGDILMYSGHTAIYIGNNQLVNASSPELGIMIRGPVTYRTLIDIRRVFDY
jgi:peptidoglycan hydrolase CwlO-like protein